MSVRIVTTAKRLYVWVVLALVSATSTPAIAIKPQSAKPVELPTPPHNILIIVADDLGTENLRAYGRGPDQIDTPRLDELINNGTQFTRAWSNPLCSPTRATIQTGRYAINYGIGWFLAPGLHGLPLDELTIPEMLSHSAHGYTSAAIGKWHLGQGKDVGGTLAPNLAGYDHYAGTLTNLTGIPGNDYYDWDKVTNGATANVQGYATTVQVDDALAFIENAPEPWFCYLAFNAPHHPFHAPPPHLHSTDLTTASAENQRPYYKAMVQALDKEMGRLLDSLQALPSKLDAQPNAQSQLDNTTIIFVADNGTPSAVVAPPFDPKHAKASPYEGGVHVPLVVSGPAVKQPGAQCSALVNTSDLFATIAELAAVDLESLRSLTKPLNSVSMRPYFSNPGLPSVRQHTFAEIFLPFELDAGWPVNPLPPQYLCQSDLGFAGPGNAQLSVCGQPLATGNTAQLLLQSDPITPFAPVTITASVISNPQFVPNYGGIFVPALPYLPPNYFPQCPANEHSNQFTTDVNGALSLDICGAGPLKLYIQAIIDDPSMPNGVQLSNALELDFLPFNKKTVRGQRFKLISNVNGGSKELYDLSADPFETNDLLLDLPLNAAAQRAFEDLSAQLDEIMSQGRPAP